MAALILVPALPVLELLRVVAANSAEIVAIAVPLTIIMASVALLLAVVFKDRWWG
jgi:hypothetical protein